MKGILRESRKTGDEYWNLCEMGMSAHEWERLENCSIAQRQSKSKNPHGLVSLIYSDEIGVLFVVVSKENAEHYVWGDICDGWHLVKHDNLSVIHERMPSGTSEIRHFHKESGQFFFVLSGIATLEVDGEQHNIGAFQGIEVPPGIPHQMMNQSQSDVEFIVVSQPMSHGDRIALEE